MTRACRECGRAFPNDVAVRRHREAVHAGRGNAPDHGVKIAIGVVAIVLLATVGYALRTGNSVLDEPEGLARFHLDGEPRMGNASAPVILLMTEDPDCPFCARFHVQSFGDIIAEYVETGKVEVFYKGFHTGHNPWSREGLIAQECAYRDYGDEAFWRLTAAFYANQPTIERREVGTFAEATLADAGHDTTSFRECYDGEETARRVADEVGQSGRLGSRGTPTFYIIVRDTAEARQMVGAQPTDQFRAALNGALAEAETT